MGFLANGSRHTIGRARAIATAAARDAASHAPARRARAPHALAPRALPTLSALALALLALTACDTGTGSDPIRATAEVRLDLLGHTITATRGELRAQAALPDTFARTLDALATRIAAGEPALDARRAIGSLALAPLESVLRDADRWIVRTTGSETVPGPLATFAAWTLPWSENDGPVGIHHAVCVDWPEGLQAVAPRPRESTGDRVLFVAPFRDGVTAGDDPDTVRAALSRVVARVETLPRNDVDPVTLRRALETDRAAMLWYRGTPAMLNSLRPAYGAFPAIFVWSLPASADPADARPALLPSTLASGGEGPGGIVLESWPAPESAVAAWAGAWTRALTAGKPADVALRTARRNQWQTGAPPRDWAAAIFVGQPEGLGAPERAPWLRRVLRGHR